MLAACSSARISPEYDVRRQAVSIVRVKRRTASPVGGSAATEHRARLVPRLLVHQRARLLPLGERSGRLEVGRHRRPARGTSRLTGRAAEEQPAEAGVGGVLARRPPGDHLRLGAGERDVGQPELLAGALGAARRRSGIGRPGQVQSSECRVVVVEEQLGGLGDVAVEEVRAGRRRGTAGPCSRGWSGSARPPRRCRAAGCARSRRGRRGARSGTTRAAPGARAGCGARSRGASGRGARGRSAAVRRRAARAPAPRGRRPAPPRGPRRCRGCGTGRASRGRVRRRRRRARRRRSRATRGVSPTNEVSATARTRLVRCCSSASSSTSHSSAAWLSITLLPPATTEGMPWAASAARMASTRLTLESRSAMSPASIGSALEGRAGAEQPRDVGGEVGGDVLAQGVDADGAVAAGGEVRRAELTHPQRRGCGSTRPAGCPGGAPGRRGR